MMVMFVITKVPRLGSEEEHREWDAREELRPMLECAVKEVKGLPGPSDYNDYNAYHLYSEFMFTLLCDDAVIKALRGREREKLATLIKQKRETFLTTDGGWIWWVNMLESLKSATEVALGKDHGISDGRLKLLLDDKNILEATKAYKVSMEKNDPVAGGPAWHKLFMLLGKARLDFLFVAINDDVCQ